MSQQQSAPPPSSVVDVDLDHPVLPPGELHERLWVVARRRGVPQGIVETTAATLVADLAAADLHGDAPLDDVPDDALPTATVVVATIVQRVAELTRCLARLRHLDYPRFEVVVVDNRPVLPADDPLPEVLRALPGVRLVRCPVPGVSAARNAGIRTATGSVIAFTDDDTEVDPGWLRAIGRRFTAQPELGAVTGLIVPAELEPPAQVWFERYYGGFAGVRSYHRLTLRAGRRLPGRATLRVTDEDGHLVRDTPVYGIGAYGAGANMAFRRSVLVGLRGFDESIGAGTPARGGEDLSLLIRTAWTGHPIGYEPAAVLGHRHRPTTEGLVAQLRDYGLGYSATLTSLVWRDPRHLVGLGLLGGPAAGRFVTQALRRVRGAGPDADAPQAAEPDYPPELFRQELSGLPRGPLAFARSLVTIRRARRARVR